LETSPSADEPSRKRRDLKSIHLEVAILHDLSHDNIVRIHELMELETQIVVVMSYESPITLLQYIQEQRKESIIWCFPENMAWSIFKQLISGVEYLHDNNTIHHNLTLDNILFDCKQPRIVIKGFSIAEIFPQQTGLLEVPKHLQIRVKHFSRPRYLNPYFTAPEILEGSCDSTHLYLETSFRTMSKADLYSCGVILVSPNETSFDLQETDFF
jgi:protein-serine/threonine kinase